jgi:hypothetical protein
MQESQEVPTIVQEFVKYLGIVEAKNHIGYLKEKEPRETKEVLEKLRGMPKESAEFVNLVLYGLLPHSDTKYAKRVSIAPAFWNIRKFFERFHYTENDWKEVANLVFNLVDNFQKNPNSLEGLIRDFISHKLSKALQCGSLSPIFFAIHQNFPIVNNREIRTYRSLSFLVFDQTDELSQRLEDYLSNIDKIRKLVDILSTKYTLHEIKDMAVLDLFCYWYDERGKEQGTKTRMAIPRKHATIPIEEKYIGNFFQSLACSEPQPYFVAMGDARNLLKLDADSKIVYNTEFQRGEVWDLPRKQKLIDSILRGYNINTIFLRQLSDGKYECLDGQQRLARAMTADC